MYATVRRASISCCNSSRNLDATSLYIASRSLTVINLASWHEFVLYGNMQPIVVLIINHQLTLVSIRTPSPQETLSLMLLMSIPSRKRGEEEGGDGVAGVAGVSGLIKHLNVFVSVVIKN